MANVVLNAGQVQSLRTAMQRAYGFSFNVPITGSVGPAGPAGPGVPAGGTTGQVLTKDSNVDYDTSWQTPATGATRYASMARYGGF